MTRLLGELDRLDGEEDAGEGSWFKLFDTFGTHVMTRVTMGGKIVELNDAKAGRSGAENGSAEEVRANLAVFRLNVNAEAEGKSAQGEKSKYEKILVFGGNPVGMDGEGADRARREEWVKTIGENPVPIEFELTSLGYFIRQSFGGGRLSEAFERNLKRYLQ